MVDTDILLEQRRITVVGPSSGSTSSDFVLATGPDNRPNITLNPDVAMADLGGGEGQVPEGKLTLRDDTDTARVELTAPGETRSERGERSELVVRDDEGNRRLELGTPNRDSDRSTSELVVSDGRENPRVQISSRRGGRREPENNGVWINGQDGIVQLGEPQSAGTDRPNIKLEGNSGIVELNDDPQFRDDFSIKLDPRAASLVAGGGGGDPSSGRVELRDSEGDEGIRAEVGAEEAGVHARLRVATRGLAGVDLYTMEPDEQGDPSAGVATFYDDAGYNAVEVRGDRGALRLGYSVAPSNSDDPTETPNLAGTGTSGTIFLDDGVALPGSGGVFRIEATDGRLEISGTGGSDPFFVIDPEDKSIKTANGWTFETQ